MAKDTFGISAELTIFIESVEKYHALRARELQNAIDGGRHCHICLNSDAGELFAYAVRPNGELIYRCYQTHGHERHPLRDILTNTLVHSVIRYDGWHLRADNA